MTILIQSFGDELVKLAKEKNPDTNLQFRARHLRSALRPGWYTPSTGSPEYNLAERTKPGSGVAAQRAAQQREQARARAWKKNRHSEWNLGVAGNAPSDWVREKRWGPMKAKESRVRRKRVQVTPRQKTTVKKRLVAMSKGKGGGSFRKNDFPANRAWKRKYEGLTGWANRQKGKQK